MKIKLSIFFSMLIFLGGCSFNGFSGDATRTGVRDVVVQRVDKDDLRDIMRKEKMVYDTMPREVTFTAVGEGIAPMESISHAQALILAKRAAMADAYAQLAGKLYGVKVNAEDTVKDAMLKDSTINSKVNGLVKNAKIVTQEFKNGLYNVTMKLDIQQDKWNEVFAY